MTTLLLDRSAWDLVLDAAGDIAVASEPYSMAQDASSAIRLFRGELWFDTSKGVPYFSQILGKRPPVSLIKGLLNAAAQSVPGIVSSACFIASIDDRSVHGQLQVRDETGAPAAAAF